MKVYRVKSIGVGSLGAKYFGLFWGLLLCLLMLRDDVGL